MPSENLPKSWGAHLCFGHWWLVEIFLYISHGIAKYSIKTIERYYKQLHANFHTSMFSPILRIMNITSVSSIPFLKGSSSRKKKKKISQGSSYRQSFLPSKKEKKKKNIIWKGQRIWKQIYDRVSIFIYIDTLWRNNVNLKLKIFIP